MWDIPLHIVQDIHFSETFNDFYILSILFLILILINWWHILMIIYWCFCLFNVDTCSPYFLPRKWLQRISTAAQLPCPLWASAELKTLEHCTINLRPGFLGRWHNHFLLPQDNNVPTICLTKPHLWPPCPWAHRWCNTNWVLASVVV